MLKANGLYGYVQNNNLKSTLLIGSFLILGQFLGLALSMFYALNFVPGDAAAKMSSAVWYAWRESGVFLLGSLMWAGLAFAFYKKMIRRGTGATPVKRAQEFKLYNKVENLSIAAGLPVPAIEIIETPMMNAYAMGLTPSTASITVTRGLLNGLNDDELDTVIAHELMHIGNLDIRLMTFATICTGITFSIVSYIFSKMIPKLSVYRPTAGLIFAFLLVYRFPVVFLGALVSFAALAVIGALLLKFSISRTREFVADAGAIELTKNPVAMMRALRKISGRDHLPDIDITVDAMLISSSASSWFATHPTLEDRLAAIESYAPNFTCNSLTEVLSARGDLGFSNIRYVTAVDAAGSNFPDQFTFPSWVSSTYIVFPVVVVCYLLHSFVISGQGLAIPDLRSVMMSMKLGTEYPTKIADYTKKMEDATKSEEGKASQAEKCRTTTVSGKKRVFPVGTFISMADSPRSEICDDLALWEIMSPSVVFKEVSQTWLIGVPFMLLFWWRRKRGQADSSLISEIVHMFDAPKTEADWQKVDQAIAMASRDSKSEVRPRKSGPMFGPTN